MPDKQDAINRLEVGFVKMPTSANEAQAMVNLGIAWLEEHAPERLRASPAQLVAPGITWTENGDKTCGYNNWVGETAFGRILITWKGWKEDADASVDEFPGGLNAYGHPNEVKAACEAEFRRRIGAQQPRIGEFVDMLRRTVGPVKAWPQYRDNLFLEITALIEWHDKNLPEQQPASAVPDFAPLTRDEVRDLSAMQAGAPWDEPILTALAECIAIAEQLRAEGKRPVDPADVIEADRCECNARSEHECEFCTHQRQWGLKP